MTKPRRSHRREPAQTAPSGFDTRGPTRERLGLAGASVEIGDDGQGTRVYTIREAPLERLRAKAGIGEHEYTALLKFRTHWHYAGLEPSIGSVDPNRVFASDPGAFSGMAKTKRQVYHRQQYRAAVQAMGMRASGLVEGVVCYELRLEDAGQKKLGWSHPMQARSAATECLRDAGYRLAAIWGIGG